MVSLFFTILQFALSYGDYFWYLLKSNCKMFSKIPIFVFTYTSFPGETPTELMVMRAVASQWKIFQPFPDISKNMQLRIMISCRERGLVVISQFLRNRGAGECIP